MCGGGGGVLSYVYPFWLFHKCLNSGLGYWVAHLWLIMLGPIYQSLFCQFNINCYCHINWRSQILVTSCCFSYARLYFASGRCLMKHYAGLPARHNACHSDKTQEILATLCGDSGMPVFFRLFSGIGALWPFTMFSFCNNIMARHAHVYLPIHSTRSFGWPLVHSHWSNQC